MENLLLYTEKMKLNSSMFDLNDKIKASAILEIFQDVAGLHVEKLGVGFKDLLEKGLLWVVTRIKFDVIKSPVPYEEVVAETWPHQSGKIDFDRDFLIKSNTGEVLIKGTSKWCVISLETRKFALPTCVQYPEGSVFYDKVNYEEKFVKTASIESREIADFSHTVEYHEIDHNMHLNNAFYATYVFDTMKSDEFSHMQINFIAECKLGDTIEVFKEKQEDGSVLLSGYSNGVLKFSAEVK